MITVDVAIKKTSNLGLVIVIPLFISMSSPLVPPWLHTYTKRKKVKETKPLWGLLFEEATTRILNILIEVAILKFYFYFHLSAIRAIQSEERTQISIG